MKKIMLALTVCAGLFAATPAKAIDSTGCGLGSIVLRDYSGIFWQLLATFLNGSFGSQTFGITSGTSGCDPHGRITGGTRKLFGFMTENMDQYAMDAARGEGETIENIAKIMEMPSEKVASVSKSNFDILFPGENVTAEEVSTKLVLLLNS